MLNITDYNCSILNSFIVKCYYVKHIKSIVEMFYFCRVVLIESRPSESPEADANLYILAGHENTY